MSQLIAAIKHVYQKYNTANKHSRSKIKTGPGKNAGFSEIKQHFVGRVVKVFVMDCLGTNEKGHLTIGNCDTLSLAAEYGTPLYVMSEDKLRDNCRLFKKSIDEYYGGNGLVIYASKAFCCKESCRIVQSEGLGLDIVSGGELYTALKAGFPMNRVYFHGNNKTYDELEFALDINIGRFVVDNLTELEMLEKLAAQKCKIAEILLRIKPGIDAHTHDFVRTGQIDSKFGLALETGEAEEAVKKAALCSHIHLVGVHCHIGSQIFEEAPFELAAQVMVNFMGDMKDRYGIILKELDLGGGFGIKYIQSQDPVQYDCYMQRVSTIVKATCKKRGLVLPFIVIEPGRSIVASAGITLYKVGVIKEIPSVRTYACVDGGMTDNPRYALYHAEYDAAIADRANEDKTKTVTIAGKCCESGDMIQENIAIQEPKVGDTLAVFATGAYNYSMASNYNRVARAPVVMVHDGNARLAVRRETYEDLIRNDI